VVTTPALAMKLSLLAGPRFTTPILSSIAIPTGTAIVVAPSGIASAYSGALSVQTSKEAVVHFEDTSPLPISTAGTPATVAAVVRSALNVMSYTNEDRDRILSDARETLERTASVRVERSNVVYISESRIDRERREIEEQEERFSRERRERTVEQIERRLSEHLSGVMSNMLLEQKDFLMEIITEVVAEMLSTLRSETEQKITELKSQLDSDVGDLRAEIANLRSELSNISDRGVVTNLPRRA
jgi:hypothetical protein